MKQLYINDNRLVMSDDTYFPFTQKVSDLEDISIIGLLATKSINIPRCQINDEIFGYVGQLNRIVVDDTDNKIGISFNQSRKIEYKLYNNSVIISEGIVKIVGVNEEEYIIELYDKVVELLEDLRGDETENTGFLSNLDLVLQNDTTFSLACTNNNIINNLPDEVVANINVKDYDSTGTKAYVNFIPTSGTAYNKVVDLESDLSPVSFRSIKGWEMEYSTPISTVIRSINANYDDILTFDSALNTLFNEVHLNLGSPKSTKDMQDYTFDGGILGVCGNDDFFSRSWGPISGNTSLILEHPIDKDSINLLQENGQYIVKIPITLKTTYNSGSSTVGTNYLSVWNDTQFYPTAPYGTKFGELFIDAYIQSFDPADHNYINYRTIPTRQVIQLFVGQNTTFTKLPDGKLVDVTINAEMELKYDYYPKFWDYPDQIKNYLMLDYTNMWDNTMIFERKNVYWFYPTTETNIGDGTIQKTNLEFKTGDLLTGQTLFPKISINEFIISIAKWFNLGLRIVDGKLNIHQKIYSLSTDIPIISEINDIQVSNINFSALKFTNEVTDNEFIKSYQDTTGKVYGEQLVYTNYNIKKSIKDVKFDIFIPSLIRDQNAYGYNAFANYYNNNYSRFMIGATSGSQDKITFGYILNQQYDFSICNDSLYEGGLYIGSTNPPTEVSFILSNERIKYYEVSNTFEYPSTTASGQSRLVNNFNTFQPYQFNSNGIVKSLELNKPEYNYAFITDDLYPSGSTHYQNYFKKYISDVYDFNTHVLDVQMWIDKPVDIYKIINVKNTLYSIQEIVEYDPTKADFYQIKLLRVNDITNYDVPPQPEQFTLNVNLTYDALVMGDKTSNYNNFYGYNSDIMISNDGVNWEYFGSSVYQPVEDNYYSSPFTHFINYYDKSKVINNNSMYIKLVNNSLVYRELVGGSYEFRLFPYPDTTPLQITTGGVSGAYQFDSYNFPSLPSNLPISDDTRRIEKFILTQPKLTNLIIWDDGNDHWILSCEMFYFTEGGNEPFDAYFRAKFGQMQILFKRGVFEYYYLNLDTTSGSSWVENLTYTQVSGNMIRIQFDVKIYLGDYYDNPQFTDLEVKILQESDPSNYAGYEWMISPAGDYSDPILAYSNGGVPGNITITNTTTPTLIEYTYFDDNGNLPSKVELDIINIPYSYSIN